MVAYSIFAVVGEVGMRRPEKAAHILVVLRVLVCVAHEKSDGSACRFPLENTTEQLHTVAFLAVGGDMALSWTASVQFFLNEIDVDVDACRHSVNNAANSLSVAFAKGGEGENMSKRIAHN